MPGDLVVDTNRHYWVRKREAKGASYAAQRYSEGASAQVRGHVASDLRHRNGNVRICIRSQRRLRCAAALDGTRVKALMPRRKVPRLPESGIRSNGECFGGEMASAARRCKCELIPVQTTGKQSVKRDADRSNYVHDRVAGATMRI